MILEMVVWGFFSAWGWIGANYIKEQIWPEEKPAIVQVQPATPTTEPKTQDKQ